VAGSIGYLLLWMSDGRALPFIEEISAGLIWAVPLSLAVSVAMFNNMLRIYDKLETVVEELSHKPGSSREEREQLEENLSETDSITIALLGQAFLAIASAVGILTLKALRQVATPSWFPTVVIAVNPSWIALSFAFGFGILVLLVLIVQFLAIPGLVAMYRFFTIDRHRTARPADGEKP
jgi:hypothetical protein